MAGGCLSKPGFNDTSDPSAAAGPTADSTPSVFSGTPGSGSTVPNVPSFTPSSASITLENSLPLTPAGGEGNLTWETIPSTCGTVSSNTFIPKVTGPCTVVLKDSRGYTAEAQYTVENDLAVSALTLTVAVGYTTRDSYTVNVTGGVAPYKLTKPASSCGTTSDLSAGAFTFTAPTSAPSGTCAITIEDNSAKKNTRTVNIIYVGKVQITNSDLNTTSPKAMTLSATGGVPPFRFASLTPGCGVNLTTGVLTPPTVASDSDPKTCQVEVSDNSGLGTHKHAVTVTIHPQIAIKLPPGNDAIVNPGETLGLIAEGGRGGDYTWSVQLRNYPSTLAAYSGSNTIYLSDGNPGKDTIVLKDSFDNQATLEVTLNYASLTWVEVPKLGNLSATATGTKAVTAKAMGGYLPYRFSITNGVGFGSLDQPNPTLSRQVTFTPAGRETIAPITITLADSNPNQQTISTSFTMLGNPLIWLDADTITQSDGSKIGSWPNSALYFNGNQLTQPTADKQPVLKVGARNGHSAVSFSGDHCLKHEMQQNHPLTSATVVMVTEFNNCGKNRCAFFDSLGIGAVSAGLYYEGGPVVTMYGPSSQAIAQSQYTVSTPNYRTLTSQFNGANSKFFSNGIPSNNSIPLNQLEGLKGISLSCAPAGAYEGTQNITEFLVYPSTVSNPVQSTTERVVIEQYLKNKYRHYN